MQTHISINWKYTRSSNVSIFAAYNENIDKFLIFLVIYKPANEKNCLQKNFFCEYWHLKKKLSVFEIHGKCYNLK